MRQIMSSRGAKKVFGMQRVIVWVFSRLFSSRYGHDTCTYFLLQVPCQGIYPHALSSPINPLPTPMPAKHSPAKVAVPLPLPPQTSPPPPVQHLLPRKCIFPSLVMTPAKILSQNPCQTNFHSRPLPASPPPSYPVLCHDCSHPYNNLLAQCHHSDAFSKGQDVSSTGHFFLGLNLNRSNFFRPPELSQKRDQHIIDFK